MPENFLIMLPAFLAVGALAGLCAGLFGIGGGMIIVPALVFLLPEWGVSTDILTQVAVGSSLACISFIAINSAWSHHRRSAVDWPIVWRMAPGLLVGALAGAAVAHLLPSLVLQRLVGTVALFAALRMFFGVNVSVSGGVPGAGGLFTAGGVIGGLSSLVGIGGGSFTVPYLVWCAVPMRHAVGTSSACGAPIAWSGAAGFMLAGTQVAGTGAASLGYVSLPAVVGIVAGSLLFTPLGARLAHSLPVPVLKKIFALLLASVGLRMWLS